MSSSWCSVSKYCSASIFRAKQLSNHRTLISHKTCTYSANAVRKYLSHPIKSQRQTDYCMHGRLLKYTCVSSYAICLVQFSRVTLVRYSLLPRFLDSAQIGTQQLDWAILHERTSMRYNTYQSSLHWKLLNKRIHPRGKKNRFINYSFLFKEGAGGSMYRPIIWAICSYLSYTIKDVST